MSMALEPPTMNQVNDVPRYIGPIVLCSVVGSRLVRRQPFRAAGAGLAPAPDGFRGDGHRPSRYGSPIVLMD